MSQGMQNALLVLITLAVFGILMSIAFSIIGGKDVAIVNMLVEILAKQFVGN